MPRRRFAGGDEAKPPEPPPALRSPVGACARCEAYVPVRLGAAAGSPLIAVRECEAYVPVRLGAAAGSPLIAARECEAYVPVRLGAAAGSPLIAAVRESVPAVERIWDGQDQTVGYCYPRTGRLSSPNCIPCRERMI
jgi:hypothetical protein